MSFQPGRKKSLSDRFGGISSLAASNNKDLIQRLDQPNHDQNKNDARNRRSVDGNTRDPRKPGTLTVHLKINQNNRHRNDNSYVNRPNRPCRIEYQDKPSELTKHFSMRGSDGGKENSKNYNPNAGRQVSLKDTPTGSQSQDYHTSPRYNRNNQTSPRYIQNYNQSSPQFDKKYNSQLSPRYIQNRNQTSPGYNGNLVKQTSPQYIQNRNQTSPRYNGKSPQYNQNVGESHSKQTSVFTTTQPTLQQRDNVDQSYCKDNFQQRQNINQPYLQNRSSPQFGQNSAEAKINFCNSNQGAEQYPPENEHKNRNTSCAPFQQFYDDFNGSNQKPGQIATVPPINMAVNKSPGFYGDFEKKGLNSDGNGMHFDQNEGTNFLERGPLPLYTGNTYLNNDVSQNMYRIPGICEPPPLLENKGFCKNQRQADTVVQNSYNSNGCAQSYDRHGFSSSVNPAQNLNTSGYFGGRQVIDDYNYNAYSTTTSSQTGQYISQSSNIQSCVNNSTSKSQVLKDGIHCLNQKITGFANMNIPASGGISPTFSPDSDMSMDSNTAVQAKENIKPSGFYTDLSQEVFPEVEALKKKFFKECDGLSTTAEDKQIVSVVKNILQTTTDLAAACNTTKVKKKSPGAVKKDKKIDKKISKQTPPSNQLIIDESKKEMNSSVTSPSTVDKFNSDMKFEGRTLLKGGVKPRHVPKMLIDKPGLDPPIDRRTVYNTARNLLELPLPKWAEEIFCKNAIEKDISSGHNLERKSDKSPLKTDNNQNIVNASKEKKDQILNIDVTKNSSNTNVARTTNTTKSNFKAVKDENLSKKKLKTDDGLQSKDDKLISNKKMKVDGKNTIDLTLGGAVMSKKKEIVTEVKAKGIKEDSITKKESSNRSQSSRSSNKDDKRYYSDNAKKDKSNSRESSRSRCSRSRSRSRNRSRSRESRCRRSYRQSDTQYRRSEHSDYRSRSRNVNRRSPVKTAFKPFCKYDSGRDNITAAIMKNVKGHNWQFNDPIHKNADMFDLERNGENEDGLSFIEMR